MTLAEYVRTHALIGRQVVFGSEESGVIHCVEIRGVMEEVDKEGKKQIVLYPAWWIRLDERTRRYEKRRRKPLRLRPASEIEVRPSGRDSIGKGYILPRGEEKITPETLKEIGVK